ncbi:hypothetical protein [Clostridium sp.]|uniref:hypothetical protein n=1 Tax=Clostridium sp. TaxID=1506 RepID=UPI001B67F0A5|nr:hypothetical protein [Clostridium sp.]MBP3914974.1 hypothetical protein [Clostridium sp.]
MEMLNTMLDNHIVQLVLCVLIGYVGFKIASKIVKALCIIGIGYVALKFLGVL